MQISEQLVLVTGACRGLGQHIARAFAAQGRASSSTTSVAKAPLERWPPSWADRQSHACRRH
ncbi:hypothetical protein [Stenotrophomonas maltophilia]|uniref:hypothetical protein n=1 Tax=Stenotrophomonas maltophilia TaxID=40324 RepID=UPI003D18E40F